MVPVADPAVLRRLPAIWADLKQNGFQLQTRPSPRRLSHKNNPGAAPGEWAISRRRFGSNPAAERADRTWASRCVRWTKQKAPPRRRSRAAPVQSWARVAVSDASGPAGVGGPGLPAGGEIRRVGYHQVEALRIQRRLTKVGGTDPAAIGQPVPAQVFPALLRRLRAQVYPHRFQRRIRLAQQQQEQARPAAYVAGPPHPCLPDKGRQSQRVPGYRIAFVQRPARP